MKKRLLSLALCLAMLLPTLLLFTSCSDEELEATGTIKPMTIVIAMMTDEKTNEAGIEATEKALNRITESNFNTHIELQLYKEDEYYAKLEEALVARSEAVAAGDKSTSIGAVTDTIFDEEKNREVTAYPATYENQIDIFFVGSKEKLISYRLWKTADATDEEYAENPGLFSESLVSTLDADLAESAPLLSKYLSAGLLEAGKVHLEGVGELCAIPSNAIYSDGEYMIVDKKLFDEFSYSIEEVTSVTALEDYLVDVVEKYPEITALYNMGSMGFESLTGKNSYIAQYVDPTVTPDATGLEPKSMLAAGTFRSTLTSIMNYAPINGKYPIPGNDLSGAEAGKFAVGFVSANEQEIKAYEEDYYVIESRKASVTTEQACSNMFAVSAFTSDTARCMEIINLLQTNKEAHNVLTYGEENVTYTIDETTDLVKRNYEGDAIYVMDIHKTGNLFITAPNTEMTEVELAYSENDWALAKSASRHVYFGPYIGFDISYAVTDDDLTKLFKPTTDMVEILEDAYNRMMVQVFQYDPEAVDEEGNPLYANYTAYLDALDTTFKRENENKIGTQLAATAGTKTIYRQYLDWKKIHYIAPTA